MKGDEIKKLEKDNRELANAYKSSLQTIKQMKANVSEEQKLKWAMEAAVSLVTSKAISFEGTISESYFAEKLGNLSRAIVREITPKESKIKSL